MSSSVTSLLGRIVTLASSAHAFRVPTPGIIVPPTLPDARSIEVAVISHELRNSLGVIRNAARLLRSTADAKVIDHARALIERHAVQMSSHIDELLDAAHPHKKVLHIVHVDLRTVVELAVSDIAPATLRRGHRVILRMPAEAVWIEADAARLGQVFSNLLINAAKYTPDGGEIIVTLGLTEGSAHICIGDSGIGIAPDMLLRMFDLFAQADSTATRAEGGSGIGLAVVRELVELHGGNVGATSAGLGQGSEFTVSLPIQRQPACL
jgi:signal transduction histidine kinase